MRHFHMPCFRREVRDGVLILKHIRKRVIDEDDIALMGQELLSILDEADNWQRIVIDFSNVEDYGGDAPEKLIEMDKKVKRLKVQWVLCSISADLLGLFEITKLTEIFTITDDLDSALKFLES